MRRGLCVAAFLVLGFGCKLAGAASITLTLTGAAPAGTVTLAGLDNGNAYAGVLDWKDGGGIKYYTYCVDVQHSIFVNSTYTFNEVSLSTLFPGAANTAKVNAIKNLWVQHIAGPSNIDTTAHVALITNEAAAEFQVALWDLLYNYDSTGNHLGTSQLTFSNPGNGLTTGDLTTILNTTTGWAKQAYLAGTYTGNLNIQALQATNGGQNQALYLGVTQNTPPVPLPSSAACGFAMFAMIGFAKLRNARSIRD